MLFFLIVPKEHCQIVCFYENIYIKKYEVLNVSLICNIGKKILSEKKPFFPFCCCFNIGNFPPIKGREEDPFIAYELLVRKGPDLLTNLTDSEF